MASSSEKGVSLVRAGCCDGGLLAAGAWARAEAEVRLRASRARASGRYITGEKEKRGAGGTKNNTGDERKLLPFKLAPRGAFQNGESSLSGARDGKWC